MGTRADFYTRHRTGELTWIGSIAWDGYPSGMPNKLLEASSLQEFKAQFKKIEKREDFTNPKEGWPWENSNTTDYAYVFDVSNSMLLVSHFGSRLYDPTIEIKLEKRINHLEKFIERGVNFMRINKAHDEIKALTKSLEDKNFSKHPKIVFPEMDKTNFAKAGSIRSGIIMVKG